MMEGLESAGRLEDIVVAELSAVSIGFVWGAMKSMYIPAASNGKTQA